MKIWIITESCCNGYVSAWRTEEAAQAEVDRLNANYRAKYGRENYELSDDEITD